MTGLCLGIDIGTSGIRTAVLDATGALISSARAQHEAQDSATIDANAWWRAVQVCIAAQASALQAIGREMSDVERIGVDGTSGTMVLTDGQINPVTPALMYNSAGFNAEAAIIAKYAPAIHITQGSNSALARALRLQSFDTDNRAHFLLHQADFIIAKLRGQGGISDHNNALKLGFDPKTGSWPKWMDQTGLRIDLLPAPYPAGEPIGPMSQHVARHLGLSPKTIVHAGTTDSIAAFLAAAPMMLGAAVTSLGTTLAIKTLSAARIDDPLIGLYSHKVGDFWLAGGASNTGGGVLAHFFSSDKLTALSQQIDPKTTSAFDYYPLLKSGERFPVNDPEYPPRMTPRPKSDAEFLHGLLEGIARIEAQSYNAIVDRGGSPVATLYTAGGGATNDTWTAIRSRVLGISPQKIAHSEASVGVARLVMGLTGG